MPRQRVEQKTLGKDRRLHVTVDDEGGIFAPVDGKGLRPAYSFGPVTQAGTRDVMFQCPTSAIPDEVWVLLMIWWQARMMGLPVVAGGFADQPGIVRHAFPFFEGQMQQVESQRRSGSAERAAAMAVGSMVKAMQGGGR